MLLSPTSLEGRPQRRDDQRWRRAGRLFTLTALLGAFFLLPSHGRAQGGQRRIEGAIGAAPARLAEALSEPRFYERLANPRIASREALQQRVVEYQELLGRIDALKASSTVGLEAKQRTQAEQAARLLRRFLDFAGGDAGRELIVTADRLAIQVPHSLSPDLRQRVVKLIGGAHARMLSKWKARLRLDMPPGLIFVKLYESRERMARDYGVGAETVGVAFPCRYLAVWLPTQEDKFWGWVEPYFIGEEFQQTVAHEFVHCFCFMTLGYQRAGGLPRWFQEGFALQFSGERRVRTAIAGPGGMTIRDFRSTREYHEFKRLFQFVSEKYGQDQLYEFVRLSLERGGVAAALPQVLDLSDEPTLVGAAVSWMREKERFQQRSLLIVVALVFVAWALMRGRWSGLRGVVGLFIVWAASLRAWLSPYYIHTSLWWAPAALSLPLAYLILRYARQRRAPEPAGIRLRVALDWPRLDDVMEPWPYEEVDLADIVQAGIEAGWSWGERDILGSDAHQLSAFLDAQPSEFFYFHHRAYRVWYEWLAPADEFEAQP